MSTQVFGSPQAATSSSPAAPAATVASATPAASPSGVPAAPGNPGAPTQQGIPNQAPVAPEAPQDPAGSTLSIGEPSNVPVEPTAPKGEENKNFDVSAHLTGDPGMDLAMNYLAGLGFTPDAEEVKAAIEKGEFSLLEAKLASMGDKANGWKEHLALAKAYLEAEDAKFESHISECENAAWSVAGGKEQWNQVCAWATSVADPEEAKSINAMLKADKVQAKAAAIYLTSLYQKAAGTVVEPVSPIQGAQPTTQAAHGALSPTEYRSAIAELVSRKGQYIDNDPEFIALNKRRAMYRG